jgi:hypothetical protein
MSEALKLSREDSVVRSLLMTWNSSSQSSIRPLPRAFHPAWKEKTLNNTTSRQGLDDQPPSENDYHQCQQVSQPSQLSPLRLHTATSTSPTRHPPPYRLRRIASAVSPAPYRLRPIASALSPQHLKEPPKPPRPSSIGG